MIDKTIGKRIKQTLYEKRMTGFELASKAKISEGGLSQIINNKIVNLKVDTALRIAKALNVSPMWLLLGDKSDESLFSEEHPVIGSDYYPVPRYEVTFDPKTDTEPKFVEYKYDRLSLFHKSYFEKYGIRSCAFCKSFKVTGDSMEPLIKNGDYVIVDCDPKLKIVDGDIYAFCDASGLHVKRLIAHLRGGLIIRSDNRLYEDEFLSKEEVSSIRVIGHVIDRAGSIIGA